MTDADQNSRTRRIGELRSMAALARYQAQAIGTDRSAPNLTSYAVELEAEAATLENTLSSFRTPTIPKAGRAHYSH